MTSTYLVIHCGYTSRLLGCPRTGPTDELLAHPNLFAIKDTLWCRQVGKPPLSLFNGVTQEEFDGLQVICPPLDGIIIFRFGPSENGPLVDTVKLVSAYDFCSFFSIDDVYAHPLQEVYEEEQGMDCEDAKDKVMGELRPVEDGDLDSFDPVSSDYYAGTLYRVVVIKEGDRKVYILTFDSESG